MPSKFPHFGLHKCRQEKWEYININTYIHIYILFIYIYIHTYTNVCSQVDTALMDAITARLDGLERPYAHSQSDAS